MIELLKVIILACQVHPSYDGWSESHLNLSEHQLKCRQKLIKCVKKDALYIGQIKSNLTTCLTERL